MNPVERNANTARSSFSLIQHNAIETTKRHFDEQFCQKLFQKLAVTISSFNPSNGNQF